MIPPKQIPSKLHPRSTHTNAKFNRRQKTKNRTVTDTTVQRPSLFLGSLFQSAGLLSTPFTFKRPSDGDIAAYDLQTVRAIRSKDINKLRELHSEGKSLNASNQYGESLIALACRIGDLEIITFMVRDAKVRLDVRDDFGRTPIHDACWTASANFDVMDFLIEYVHPSMLIAEDVRGSTPFDYCRRANFAKWLEYLESRKERLLRRLKACQTLEGESSESIRIASSGGLTGCSTG